MKEIRIRRDIKYPLLVTVYTLLITILIVLGINLFNMLNGKFNKSNDIIYTYNVSNNSFYNVYLKSNPFITTPILGMNKMYINDLIDYIDINFFYDYIGSVRNDLNYKYNITANIIGLYTDDLNNNSKEVEVWNKEYILKDTTNITDSISEFNIKENIKLNLNNYNTEVDQFRQTFGIPIKAMLSVVLNIEISGSINSKNFNNKYINTLNIPLGVKAFQIDKAIDTDDKINIYAHDINKELNIPNLILVIGSIIIVFLIGILFTRKFVLYNKDKWERSVNRILKEYDDKIIVVDNLLHLPNINYIAVSKFDELIELSDELTVPILFWHNEKANEAWFCIISKNIIYRYIMKKSSR